MTIEARRCRWSRLLVGTACAAAVTLGVPGVASAAPAAPPAAAAQSADAAQRARTAWETHGRPTALVIVRPTGLDLVDQGRLAHRIPRPGRPFVLVFPGGRLTATDATISDLGTAPRDARAGTDARDDPGLDFHAGSATWR